MKIVNNRGKNVTPEQHQTVVTLAKECLRELRKKKYELPILDRPLAINTKKKGQHSNGGLGQITIDISSYCSGKLFNPEYPAYANDKFIGSCRFYYPVDALRLTVAHEIAHHIQRTYVDEMPEYLRSRMRKPHGEGFKTLYRYLRKSVVNKHAVTTDEEVMM